MDGEERSFLVTTLVIGFTFTNKEDSKMNGTPYTQTAFAGDESERHQRLTVGEARRQLQHITVEAARHHRLLADRANHYTLQAKLAAARHQRLAAQASHYVSMAAEAHRWVQTVNAEQAALLAGEEAPETFKASYPGKKELTLKETELHGVLIGLRDELVRLGGPLAVKPGVEFEGWLTAFKEADEGRGLAFDRRSFRRSVNALVEKGAACIVGGTDSYYLPT